jgi:hypothetical protein
VLDLLQRELLERACFFFLIGKSCRSYCKEIIIIVQCILVLLIIIVLYGDVPPKYDYFQRFVAMLYRKNLAKNCDPLYTCINVDIFGITFVLFN